MCGMMNLHYEIRFCQKIDNIVTITVYVKFVVQFNVNKTLHHFYFRFLTAGDFLQLWQHEVKEGASENVSFQLGAGEDSDQETQTTWSCLWKTRPANSIAFLAYSSDGSLFATAGAATANLLTSICLEHTTRNVTTHSL